MRVAQARMSDREGMQIVCVWHRQTGRRTARALKYRNPNESTTITACHLKGIFGLSRYLDAVGKPRRMILSVPRAQ